MWCKDYSIYLRKLEARRVPYLLIAALNIRREEMEEFADLLREIQSDSEEDNRRDDLSSKKTRSSKKSTSSSGITAQLVENQQLSFQLANEVRSLRQQLADEKQSKRLLAASNANLEAQLQKIEKQQVALDHTLRVSETRRVELQNKLEDEVRIVHTLYLS